MRRFHLIELHEQTWYPASWRRLFQSGMGRCLDAMDAFGSLSGHFQGFLQRVRPTSVMDLCSGSGELAVKTWNSMTAPLAERDRPLLLLSDLYPNVPSFTRLKEAESGIDFHRQPVNALRPPKEARVRTMFNCLHHFRPEQVKEILGDAAKHAEGFAAVEVTSRKWLNLVQSFLLLPFVSVIATAFLVRPFHFRNILWGLLVPVVPITAFIDGMVSNLRTYTPEELSEMSRSVGDSRFEWEVGTVKMADTPFEATYIFGWRAEEAEEAEVAPEAEAAA
ncbi:MAG: hypothetical protein GY719_17115 [bacterium]|nr:hypothetical protein [bacterium]